MLCVCVYVFVCGWVGGAFDEKRGNNDKYFLSFLTV